MELGKDTKLTLKLETIASVVVTLVMVVGVYFSLKADIELAKELPEPEVGRTEYDLKDQMVRDTIMNTQDNSLTLSEAEWEELEDRIKRLRYGLLDLYIFAIALCEGGPSDATIMKTFIDDKKVLKNAATSRGS